ncbi:MAG TPA: DNA polymerase I, partial [candidate division Zixibacteria bacterium]|nr:DNA polymerase I [candidate division Zixibacteria bacterium]
DPAKRACHHLRAVRDLEPILAPRLDEMGLRDQLARDLELSWVLADMEREGVRIDVSFLGELSVQMERRLEEIRREIYRIAGTEFNINSTQQLAHILFEKLGLPTKGKTTKKTGFSTDVRVLEELAALHELPARILDFRQLTKLKSTYVDALPKLVDGRTGRVHTSFNQTIAATGRLSSTDPNLQNIPVRTDEGREIRKAFVPRDEGHTLLVADYSQIELRILAHMSEDSTLIEAFRRGEDIHARTAAEVYGVEIGQVTPEQRRAAKTANFAVIYGVTAYGLAAQSALDVGQAKAFIATYFERYPGIRRYLEATKEFARARGYVTTMFNRRRTIREINDRNVNVRQFAERAAINTPIQGTAADMIKKAMIRIHGRLRATRSRMILQVHDELVLDVPREELDEVREIVRDGMEQAVSLKVPIVVSLGSGPNWLDAK